MKHAPLDAPSYAVQSREMVLEYFWIHGGNRAQYGARALEKFEVSRDLGRGAPGLRVCWRRIERQQGVRLRSELLFRPFSVSGQGVYRWPANECSFVGVGARNQRHVGELAGGEQAARIIRKHTSVHDGEKDLAAIRCIAAKG